MFNITRHKIKLLPIDWRQQVAVIITKLILSQWYSCQSMAKILSISHWLTKDSQSSIIQRTRSSLTNNWLKWLNQYHFLILDPSYHPVLSTGSVVYQYLNYDSQYWLNTILDRLQNSIWDIIKRWINCYFILFYFI